jgi:hypothetical protein
LRGDIERRAMVHVGMDGVDEHHARNLLAMARGEHVEVECAEVVPNQDVRSGDSSIGEKGSSSSAIFELLRGSLGASLQPKPARS